MKIVVVVLHDLDFSVTIYITLAVRCICTLRSLFDGSNGTHCIVFRFILDSFYTSSVNHTILYCGPKIHAVVVSIPVCFLEHSLLPSYWLPGLAPWLPFDPCSLLWRDDGHWSGSTPLFVCSHISPWCTAIKFSTFEATTLL